MVTFPRDSTARTRELGAELRRARRGAELTGDDLGFRIGWSISKVSRTETGNRRSTALKVARFATACGMGPADTDRLVKLAEVEGYWVQPTGEPMPNELRSLIALETTAKAICTYEPLVIPGLLQTEGYIRALFTETGFIKPDGIEPRVRARLARQSVLQRKRPPTAIYLVHENALRTLVGGPQVMHEQLLHLLFSSTAGRCQTLVVPRSAGGHAGGLYGAFVLFTHDGGPPTVSVEHLTTTLFLDEDADIDVYRDALRRLAACALNEGDSRSLLADLANSYDQLE